MKIGENISKSSSESGDNASAGGAEGTTYDAEAKEDKK